MGFDFVAFMDTIDHEIPFLSAREKYGMCFTGGRTQGLRVKILSFGRKNWANIRDVDNTDVLHLWRKNH
jgi:hypothetical protein